jgi:hypothetical protein
MSGKKVGFVTGANAKLKIGTKTLAYATDCQYSVTVFTAAVEGFGRYEVLANEPVAYTCEGMFNVIRYTKAAKIAGITDAATNGNPSSTLNGTAAGGTANSAADHLDPSQILLSSTFDLDIFQKVTPNSGPTAAGTPGIIGIYRIKDCRIVRRGATLSKRGVLVDSYSFVGIISGDLSADGATMAASEIDESDLE